MTVSQRTINNWPLDNAGISCSVCTSYTDTECGRCFEPLCDDGCCIEDHIEKRHPEFCQDEDEE